MSTITLIYSPQLPTTVEQLCDILRGKQVFQIYKFCRAFPKMNELDMNQKLHIIFMHNPTGKEGQISPIIWILRRLCSGYDTACMYLYIHMIENVIHTWSHFKKALSLSEIRVLIQLNRFLTMKYLALNMFPCLLLVFTRSKL